jgi:hypothetical protein
MEPLRPWLAASRPERALLAPLCVAVGSSYAHFDAHRGPGHSVHLVVALAAFAAALGVNLFDYAWVRLGAPPPDPKTPVPEELVTVDARDAIAAGVAAIVLSALCGLALAPLSGAALLGYGAGAVVLGVLRGAPVVGLDTLGWGLGEIASVVAFGPLAAMAGFASQTGTGSTGAFLAGLPAGLVATAGLFGRRGGDPNLEGEVERGIAVALPLLAAGAIALAARSGEYGPWAPVAALPLIVASGVAWRLPPRPTAADFARWERPVLACAALALAVIVGSLALAPPR